MSSPSERGTREPKPLIGVLAMDEGWISANQLMEAVSAQAQDFMEGRHHRPIGQILVAHGLLTPSQVEALLDRQRREVLPVKAAAPPARTDLLGSVSPTSPLIFGRYLLLSRLSEGTTGEVFEAIDSRNGTKVALKVFFAGEESDSAEAARRQEWFLREFKLAARIPPHPHIVKMFDVGVVDGRRFIAMEFIEGEPMSRWLERESISFRQKIELLRDVSAAIHHTHEHGIIHRDLKPWNILVDGRNEPHIADFGLAKTVRPTGSDVQTISGMLVGTPAYMSPEQAQGKKDVDARTDVYSLGVMLYEILTGRTPFGDKATIMTLVRIVSEPPPPPSRVVADAGGPGVDPALERICLKALSVEPARRHASARALADDLGRWIDR